MEAVRGLFPPDGDERLRFGARSSSMCSRCRCNPGACHARAASAHRLRHDAKWARTALCHVMRRAC